METKDTPANDKGMDTKGQVAPPATEAMVVRRVILLSSRASIELKAFRPLTSFMLRNAGEQ